MKRLLFAACASTLLFAACNNDTDSTVEKADSANEAKQDAQPAATADAASSSFLVDAANGGMAEVALSQMAQGKSTNAKVKDFASMMINDHTGANGEVKALAAKKNVTLPMDVTQAKKDKTADVAKKTGNDFDKAYMDVMLSDHKETIDLFEKASGDVKDTEVKTFVDATLPKLRSHLEMAKTVRDGLK